MDCEDEVCHSPVCDHRCGYPRCMGPAPKDTALDILKSLWDDKGLVQLMRPDQVRRIEDFFGTDKESPLLKTSNEVELLYVDY